MAQHESAIEQINLGYNHPEDRLLLRLGLVDQSEMAVWLSRRICKVMWSLLQTLPSSLSATTLAMEAAPAKDFSNKEQALASFARDVSEQHSIDHMDFKSEYIAERQRRTELPLLAVQCVMISPDTGPSALALECSNGQTVRIALNNPLVHAITSMLQLTTREAGWDLPLADEQKTNIQNLKQQVLH